MRRLPMIATITSVALLPAILAQSDPISSDPTIAGNSSGSRTEITGEASETIELPDSSSGEPSSQGRRVVTASDPSLWEEQSHRECSPEKDAYGLDKYTCNLATLHRPGQPDQPTSSGGGPRTVTITTRQAATLIASGSGITRQPPGPKVIISKAFIVYTNPTVRYQTTTILGTGVRGVSRTGGVFLPVSR